MKLLRKSFLSIAPVLKALEKDSTHYNFNAKVRYALGKNLRLLITFAEDVERTKATLIEANRPEGDYKDGCPELKRVNDQLTAFLLEEEDLPGVISIAFEDLDLDRNQIPVHQLADLMHIVRDPSEPVAKA